MNSISNLLKLDAPDQERRAERANHEEVIYGLEGIFRAIALLDDGARVEGLRPEWIKETRLALAMAGEQLCTMAAERF